MCIRIFLFTRDIFKFFYESKVSLFVYDNMILIIFLYKFFLNKILHFVRTYYVHIIDIKNNLSFYLNITTLDFIYYKTSRSAPSSIQCTIVRTIYQKRVR